MLDAIIGTLSIALLIITIGVVSVLYHGRAQGRKTTVKGYPVMFMFFAGPVLAVLEIIRLVTGG